MDNTIDKIVSELTAAQRRQLINALQNTPLQTREPTQTPSPLSKSDRWRAGYKDLCGFLNEVDSEADLWWDGWVADFEFDNATRLMKLTLIRFDQRRRNLFFSLVPIKP